MQAYDKKRRRVVNVERSEGNVIVAYSLPGEPGINLPEEVWKNIDTVIMTRLFQEELVVEKQEENEGEKDE